MHTVKKVIVRFYFSIVSISKFNVNKSDKRVYDGFYKENCGGNNNGIVATVCDSV